MVRAALSSIAVAAFAATAHAQAAPSDAGEIEIDPAPAQPSAAPAPDASGLATAWDPKAAGKWLAAGQRLMQQAAFYAARNRPDDARAQLERAVAAFHRALDTGGDPNVRLALALAADKLGKPDEAVKQLRALAAGTQTGVRPDVAKRAAAKLAELTAKIGLVTLAVTPAGASITLGGVELGTAPLAEPLVLLPGTYTLAFQADGFQPREAEIRVEPGSENVRAIELDKIPIVVEPVRPLGAERAADVQAPEPARSRLALYAGAAATLAGIAGTTIFGALAVGEHRTFTGAATPAADREDARSRGRQLALAADVSLGVAIAAAGFTAAWYLFKYRQMPAKAPDHTPERHAAPVTAKLDLVPWVQSQSGGVTLAGWF